MNIFVTSTNFTKAAQDLDDKRVRHMFKESIEMLAFYANMNKPGSLPNPPYWSHPGKERTDIATLYGHRCSLWVRENYNNMMWLYRYTYELMREHVYRFSGAPEDKWLKLYTDFTNCTRVIDPMKMPRDYAPVTRYRLADVSKLIRRGDKTTPLELAYRLTMIDKWLRTDAAKPPVFTRRGKPDWFNEVNVSKWFKLTPDATLQQTLKLEI